MLEDEACDLRILAEDIERKNHKSTLAKSAAKLDGFAFTILQILANRKSDRP